jgi:hypothetical protein
VRTTAWASFSTLYESIAAGVVVYTAALLTQWLCSGRAPGPEQLAISALRG